MMLAMLRTAFLAYVRVLLCLQGVYLTFQVWEDFSGRADVIALSFALIGTYFGLAGILTAAMIRRGRRRAVIAAMAIEALWVAGAAALGNLGRYSGGQGEFRFFAVAALSLIALAGLLLPPVRTYAGLARR
jgi:hypothetical protein